LQASKSLDKGTNTRRRKTALVKGIRSFQTPEFLTYTNVISKANTLIERANFPEMDIC